MSVDCGDRPMANRYASHWQRLRCYLTPSASSGYRDLIAFGMIGEGLIRFVDGALFPTPQMDYLPARTWGLLQFALGVLLVLTRDCRRRAGLSGRIAASVGCGFLVAMAYTLFETSAASAFVHGGAAFVLALEAQVHDCQ